MLKGKLKLKLPDKAKCVFPDRLGSLVVGFDDKMDEDGGGGSDLVFESGEELETIQPNGYGSSAESDNDDFDDEKVERESDLRVRQQKPERDGPGSASVLAAIAADDKRSDLEYEVRSWELHYLNVLVHFDF